jgi:hypothetical protein
MTDLSDTVVQLSGNDPVELSTQLGQALALPIVLATRDMDADQRLVFWTSHFAGMTGMAEASIGFDTSRTVLRQIADLKPSSITTLQ